MDEQANRNFTSFKTALKVCSYAALVYACVDLHRAFIQLGKVIEIWNQMMDGKPMPLMSSIGDLYMNWVIVAYLFYALLLFGSLYLTTRSEGGAFLYLNVGVFVVLGMVKQAVFHAAFRLIAMPIESMASG